MTLEQMMDLAKRVQELRLAGAYHVRISLGGVTSVYTLVNGNLELDSGPGFAIPGAVHQAIASGPRMGHMDGYGWTGELV